MFAWMDERLLGTPSIKNFWMNSDAIWYMDNWTSRITHELLLIPAFPQRRDKILESPTLGLCRIMKSATIFSQR